MSIANPSRGILNFKTIPVDCSSCEYYGDLSNVSDDTKIALIGATTAHQFNEERKMLMKIQELFNRHPNSKHKIILNCTSRSVSYGGDITPEPDPEFEKDLHDNPDIAEYMRNKIFALKIRLYLTRDADKKLQSFQNRKDITCPNCGSCLVVPNSFYHMVGSYQDDICLERSRNPRFWPTAFRNSKNLE
ncbi:MAG: hypothetical protein RQ936_02260 [Gammaproteobacteria bacterium]|nr:hypothetical protein [Gammaproteobacteria bacterium]